MPSRKTNEEFIVELSKANPNIQPIEEYKSALKKIRFRCLIDMHEWSATPNNLLMGHGCPLCSSRKSSERLLRTNEEFLGRLNSINPNICPIEKYVDSQTKIMCRCTIDGYEWRVRPNDLLRGKGCPECKKVKLSNDRMKPHDKFVQEVAEISPNITIVGIYCGSVNTVRCKCELDGFEWDAFPGNLLKGEGCPRCSESRGERAVSRWLDANNIKYHAQFKFNDCRNSRPLPFDFFIPSHNLCIEFDGQQHFRPVKFGGCSDESAKELFERTVRNDVIKSDYCFKNKLSLLRIRYDEIGKIDDILERSINNRDFSKNH